MRILFVLLVSAACFAQTNSVSIFERSALHFSQDSSGKFLHDGERALDNGRVVEKTVTLPKISQPTRITARLDLHPVPLDELKVADRYDRGGAIRLVLPNQPELEILRFMTSFGGETSHEADVTQLAPLLQGECVLRASVDTWVSPGWELDFALEYTPDTTAQMPDYAAPIYFADSFTREGMPDGVTSSLAIPEEYAYAVIYYTSTGHCTDGRDEDEFVSKANVISVDGHVIERFHPWRDDCKKMRPYNPYCARWTDGWWSSDFSRSGWCPGDIVLPREIDATDALPKGEHSVGIRIENMRPKDENNHFGVWKVSAYVVAWKTEPKLWQNWGP
ncbi:MAG: hypothetical protein H6505_05755 [Calditrichaeota bacterium]|nr:hypothetical protein [Calditrichota bacterium]